MARAHFVKKARKADKDHDIKVGDSYYWWKFRYGGLHKSKTPPKPSQLTGSEFLGTVLALEEDLSSYTVEGNTQDDIKNAIEEAVSDLENLRDETQEKFYNMPEGLQQGDTGQLLEGRVSSVEDMIQELEGLDTDQEIEALIEELQGITYGGE